MPQGNGAVLRGVVPRSAATGAGQAGVKMAMSKR